MAEIASENLVELEKRFASSLPSRARLELTSLDKLLKT
jgi:hypothetical protein